MLGLNERINEIAGRIRALREIMGLSPEEMAKEAGVSVTEYLECEEEIVREFKKLPTAREIEEILRRVGLDTKTFRETYSEAKLRDAIKYAKDLKDRYTVLVMYFDLYGTEEI